MRKGLYWCLFTTLFFIYNSEVGAQGILKASGQKIVDENGNEVIWRGIGFGGWMLQEGYMLGTTGPQHEIEAKIEDLIGPEKKEQFYEAWWANHVRKIDIDSMGAWGYNMVRLPMHYKLFTPPIEEEPVPGEITWREKGFAMVDSLLNWCEANDIYLVLDMHAAPGGQGENADISDYDPSKPSLWESETNKVKMIALWKKLADRYADEPYIGGYDIINEPNWGFENHEADPNGCSETNNTALWELEQDITEAIREVDQKHIIIIEGNCWGNNYSGLPTLWDDNLVVSFHKYWNANTVGAIQGMLDMRTNRNVPIWLGETGENSNTWFTNAVSLFESNDMGWSWWPLKKLGQNNPLQIKRNEGYQKILDYWSGNGEKPTVDEAFDALMQLTEDLKLENNIYHKDVVDAVIRQPHTDEIIPFTKHTITEGGENLIFATDYDLGKNEFAYFDNVATNTTGNAGGATWNNGYAYRNDGVDIEACEDDNSNGYNVGWTEAGEWLKYTVNVEQEGNYQLDIRTASTSANGKVSIYVDDVKATESITLPSTSGNQIWETTTVKDVYLPAGAHVIKLHIDQGGFNLNYFQFSGPADADQQPVLLEKQATHEKKKIGLIFNQAFEEIPTDHGFSVTVNDEDATVSSVVLAENTPQKIVITLENALDFSDNVFVSYSGTGVVTKSGVVLDPFSDEKVDITLEGGAVPLAVPGKIEAEDFTVNNGFESENTEDSGGGLNLGYTDYGDYLDYTVNVEQTGYYEAAYRVSSQDTGGSLTLKTVDQSKGIVDVSKVEFEATGGWQTWKTAEGTMAHLEKGLQTLRLQATASLFNINWFKLSFLWEEQPTGFNELDNPNGAVVYPNPSTGQFHIKYKQAALPQKIMLYSATGSKLMELTPAVGSTETIVNPKLKPGFYLLVMKNHRKLDFRHIVIKK